MGNSYCLEIAIPTRHYLREQEFLCPFTDEGPGAQGAGVTCCWKAEPAFAQVNSRPRLHPLCQPTSGCGMGFTAATGKIHVLVSCQSFR